MRSTRTSTLRRDVEQVIGFPPIGVLLDHDDFSSEASGQYLLRLAGGIQHARNSAGARTFLFTATASESGTTTVVEKLGRQLRNLGLNTLTVAATNIDGKIAYVRNEGPVTSSEAGATRYSDKLRRAGADLAVQRQFRHQQSHLQRHLRLSDPQRGEGRLRRGAHRRLADPDLC